MTLDLKRETGTSLTSLAVIPDVESGIDIIGSAAKGYRKVCYVSFSKPYYSFIEFFKVNRIDPNKFFFIDCITRSVMPEQEDMENCTFVSGPNEFAEINTTIRETLQSGTFDVLLFDSLSALLVYEKEMFVTRFVHNLAAMIKGLGCSAVFLLLEKDVDADVVSNLGMLVDKTLAIGKPGSG